MSNRQIMRTSRSRRPQFQRETATILKSVQVDNSIYRRKLVFEQLVTTDAIGTLAYSFAMNPNGASDWASVASLYDEFRVVGMAVTLVPQTQFSVTNGQGLITSHFDNDDSSIPTSYLQTLEFANVKCFPSVWTTEKALRFQYARPSSGTETSLPWIDIGAPGSSLGAVKIYSYGHLTAITTYFHAVVEWAVEFRGIR